MLAFWKQVLVYLLPKVKAGYAVFSEMTYKEKILCVICFVIGYFIGKVL